MSILTQQRSKETKKDKYSFYIIQCCVTNVCKIGISRDVEERLKQISRGYPHDLRIVTVCYCENASEREQQLFTELSEYRLNGEWFSVDCVPMLSVMVSEIFNFSISGCIRW